MKEIITYFAAHKAALYLILYLICVNLWVFILCGSDKYKSTHGKWRTRERTFFILSALGGSPLMLLGMYLFRHKTKHRDFTICIPMMLALQIVLAVYLEYKYSLLLQIFV